MCLHLSLYFYHWFCLYYLLYPTISLPFPLHYLYLCRCFAFFFLQNSSQNVHPVFGAELNQKDTQSVSEQAFPRGRKNMAYPWKMEWRLLSSWSCPVHPGSGQGRRHLALKVMWVLEGRTEDGVLGNALRVHQRQLDSNGHQQRVAESIMVPPQMIMSFTHCVAL